MPNTFGVHFWAWCHTCSEGSGTLKHIEMLVYWVRLLLHCYLEIKLLKNLRVTTLRYKWISRAFLQVSTIKPEKPTIYKLSSSSMFKQVFKLHSLHPINNSATQFVITEGTNEAWSGDTYQKWNFLSGMFDLALTWDTIVNSNIIITHHNSSFISFYLLLSWCLIFNALFPQVWTFYRGKCQWAGL